MTGDIPQIPLQDRGILEDLLLMAAGDLADAEKARAALRVEPSSIDGLDPSIRWTLWMACPHDMKYGDDGELQCRGVDFRRGDLNGILTHVREALTAAALSSSELTATPTPERRS